MNFKYANVYVIKYVIKHVLKCKLGGSFMEWILMCNHEAYRIEQLIDDIFDGHPKEGQITEINWKQDNYKFEVNDTVYIYVAKPVGAILCKCIVTEINLEKETIDDSEYVMDSSYWYNADKYMTIKFVESYKNNTALHLDKLQENGMKTNPTAIKIKDTPLLQYIQEVTE
jgi:predicted transcriptional regulator